MINLIFNIAQQQLPTYSLPPLPPGTGLTETAVQGLLIQFANFLIWAGVVIAVIVIVWSGIMYFRAGSDTEAKAAKGWFRNGIIGAVIILAVGVIILTIYNIVVTGTFFGGAPIIPTPTTTVSPTSTSTPSLGKRGDSCNIDANCESGLTCSITKICIFPAGNYVGEKCNEDIDCLAGLKCKSGIFGAGPKTCQQP